MKSTFRYAAAGAAVALLVGAAQPGQAQQLLMPGFYMNLHGGVDFMEQAGTRVAGGGLASKGKTDFDVGWQGGGALGYEMPVNWMVLGDSVAIEEEFTYRENGLSKYSNPTSYSLGGNLHSYAAMTNGYYRYNTGTPFTPYIGAGIGVAIHGIHITAPFFPGTSFSDTDTNLAYQGIVGVSYAFTPQLSLGLEYRYFGTTTAHFKDTIAVLGPSQVTTNDHSHDLLVSLTYHFQ
jgi:opacity protein-like surface antigen